VLKVRKGVRDKGRTLRIITPLSLQKVDERLDNQRVTYGKTPMVRGFCAQWSSLPAIRSCGTTMRRVLAVLHIVDKFSPFLGPVPPVLIVVDRYRSCCADSNSEHEPER